MLNPLTLAWRDDLVLTREITIAGDRTDFYQRVRAGEFVSLRRGVYMRKDRWDSMNPDDQYRARVHAAVAFASGALVVSHVSAAAIWRLPMVGPYPRAIHALHQERNGGRSSSALTLHKIGDSALLAEIEGVTVTSLARTVVDVARTTTFTQAVAVADAALRRTRIPHAGLPLTDVTKEGLREVLSHIPVAHGTARASRVIEFADGLADRPGESVSRVNVSLARLTPPILQQLLRGASGRSYYVDFWWPKFNLIGEFDGKGKYVDDEFLAGRTPQQALYEEKLREDDLRAADHRFSRWPWEVANSMPHLRAHLIAAGLR
ncbi:MAG TPA: hypothetical protein VGI56_00405 [Galbitalea sp.]